MSAVTYFIPFPVLVRPVGYFFALHILNLFIYYEQEKEAGAEERAYLVTSCCFLLSTS
jgi:hypothetical protein